MPGRVSVLSKMKEAFSAVALAVSFALHLDDIMSPDTRNPNCPAWLLRTDTTADEWLELDFLKQEKALTDVDRLRLVRLEHFKATSGVKHEYCMATIVDEARLVNGDRNFDPAVLIYLRYDRYVDLDRSQSKPLEGTASVSSSQRTDRKDTVCSLTRERYEKMKSGANLLRTLEFESFPSVLHLAVVTEVHSRAAPRYHLFSTMCYWFAGSTFEVLHTYFSPAGGKVVLNDKHWKAAGKALGYPAYKISNGEIDGSINVEVVVNAERGLREKTKGGPLVTNEEKDLRDMASNLPTLEQLRARHQQREAEARQLLAKNKTVHEEAARADEAEARADKAEARAEAERARADDLARQLQAARLSASG